MTAAAASRPAVTATCADLHGYGRCLPLLCVNDVWTVWRYVSAQTISVYFTNMLWTMVVVTNETSSTLKPVHRSVTVCTTRDETAPRPQRTPHHGGGIQTCAMRWGPWSRVAECTALHETGTPVTSFRQGQRGTPHHRNKRGNSFQIGSKSGSIQNCFLSVIQSVMCSCVFMCWIRYYCIFRTYFSVLGKYIF